MKLQWGALLASVGIPLGLGTLSGFLTGPETSGAWYQALKKPSWQPPRAVFPVVWTVLYALMGLAAYRVWAAGGDNGLALALYALQLGLNIAWSFLFFRARNLTLALVDIVALLGVLLATVAAFYRVDPTAAYLLVPYVAWLMLATALTTYLYANNPPATN